MNAFRKPLDKFEINRSAIRISMNAPFIDWIEQHEKDVVWDPLSMAGDIYLVEGMNDDEEMEVWLRKNFGRIFEDQLERWKNDPKYWPKKRKTFRMFGEWFDYSFHPIVVDTKKYPIDRYPL